MTSRLTRSHALLAVGLLLLVAPAFAPLQPVLEHDTRRGTFENESVLEEEGYRVVEYEALSERGKALYVQTLQNEGTYTVPTGEGASDFRYPTEAEVDAQGSYEARVELSHVVIERPENASLPPADEDVEHAVEIVKERQQAREDREGEGRTTSTASRTTRSEAEIRRQVARYDVMQTRTTKPGVTSQPAVLRFGAAALGIVLVGVGGYLTARP
ncbi:hypothetical protein [Halorubellus litoreus]|uniref:Uncharacterized protein n=1 Tax=Halorubellus litoreus TaxID=755308 RepID=A0ABD5VFH7_9EURY